MPFNADAFRLKLNDLADQWQRCGLPGRQTLMDIAQELQAWKISQNIPGLWPVPPIFATATIDDAWGHGLELIETYAKILGMAVKPIGLEKSAKEIIRACNEIQPEYLGMTVLQFDSEEDLCEIGSHIPRSTQLIVGGPIFQSDPDLAKRVGVHYTAKDITAFLKFFLSEK